MDLKRCICFLLSQVAHDFTMTNFDVVSEREEFRDLDHSDVIELLSSNQLHVSSEETVSFWCDLLYIPCLIHAWPVLFQVFRAVESWISHKSDRADYFPSLMECVRLPLLPKPFVRSLLESNDLVLAEHRVQAVMRDLLQVSGWRRWLFDSEQQ